MVKQLKLKRPDYNRVKAPPATMICTLEAVVQVGDMDAGLERMREALCEYGYAEIVQRDFTTQTFDQACDILRKRKAAE